MFRSLVMVRSAALSVLALLLLPSIAGAVSLFAVGDYKPWTVDPTSGSLTPVGSTTWDTSGSSYALYPTGIAFQGTVPIPPAVWLFGSALGLMGWMRRKAVA